MDLYGDITSAIYELFRGISEALQPLGIPFGPIAWFVIIYSIPVWLTIIFLVLRLRRGGGGARAHEGIRAIIASTGDVSAGMSGTKKVSFIKNPSDALVFLKIEENAIQQAITAIDYYEKQGEIDESIKEKFVAVYQDRLATVRAAIAKDEQLKTLVDTESAVDRARSDYLRKLAAMSGTQVETDTEGGPPSVGAPGAVESTPAVTPAAGPPSAAPEAAPPSGGPPGGGPPGGGPPSGGPPGGGPPGGGPPSGAPGGGPPGAGTPSGPPSGVPTASPPSEGVPSGPPSEAGPPGGAPAAAPGGKSSLQSEMLAEMERLKALMSGD